MINEEKRGNGKLQPRRCCISNTPGWLGLACDVAQSFINEREKRQMSEIHLQASSHSTGLIEMSKR
jgi:hypothetical protein